MDVLVGWFHFLQMTRDEFAKRFLLGNYLEPDRAVGFEIAFFGQEEDWLSLKEVMEWSM